MRKTLSGVAFIALTSFAHAQTSDQYGGAYLCLEEAGGGLRWNEVSRKWEGSVFTPQNRFILKLDSRGNRTVKNFLGDEVQVTDYAVTITTVGEDFDAQCTPDRSWDSTVVAVGAEGWVHCTASITDHSFNLSELRYLASYRIGFTSGLDNNDNTPSMMGGTCVKVDL